MSCFHAQVCVFDAPVVLHFWVLQHSELLNKNTDHLVLMMHGSTHSDHRHSERVGEACAAAHVKMRVEQDAFPFDERAKFCTCVISTITLVTLTVITHNSFVLQRTVWKEMRRAEVWRFVTRTTVVEHGVKPVGKLHGKLGACKRLGKRMWIAGLRRLRLEIEVVDCDVESLRQNLGLCVALS